MSITNTSYITDLTELDLLTNYTVFKQICTIQGDSVDPTSTLTGTRLDRAYTALNYGKAQIDAMLYGTYSVPFNASAISNTYPSLVIKQWNVQFAIIWLWQFHHDKLGEAHDALMNLHSVIKQYTDNSPAGLVLPGETKLVNALGYSGPTRQRNVRFDTDTYFSEDVMDDDA